MLNGHTQDKVSVALQNYYGTFIKVIVAFKNEIAKHTPKCIKVNLLRNLSVERAILPFIDGNIEKISMRMFQNN